MKSYKDVSSYIKDQPKNVQALLKKMRTVIKKAAPKAEERISYGMPGYYQNGQLVFFGAFKNHLSFFPAGGVRAQFKKELATYVGGKGTVQLPLDKAIPFGLITKIVKFRVKENLAKK